MAEYQKDQIPIGRKSKIAINAEKLESGLSKFEITEMFENREGRKSKRPNYIIKNILKSNYVGC